MLILKRNWRGDTTRVGDNVWNGQPLAEIPDLSTMEAEVYVLEADAGGLKAGKPATVAVESAPGVTYPARIQRVDALAKPRIPRLAGAVFRRHPGARQDRSAGDEAGAAGAWPTLLLDERKDALAGAAPGGLRPRGALGRLPQGGRAASSRSR